jgi:type IV secretion system protein VirB9
MKKILILCGLAFGLSVTSAVLAEIVPKEMMEDRRVKQVEYQKNNVVTIHGQAFISTQIIFDNDESILDVQGGDEAGWTVHIDKVLPYILNIKPTLFNSNTNLAVVTSDNKSDKRIYRFHLLMGNQIGSDDEKPTYAVEFVYPDKEQEKLEDTLNYLQRQKKTIINSSKKPGDYHWDYSFSGDKEIMPLHAFDDGQFTYFQLRPGQAVPAVFAVDNSAGEESVVNTRTEGDYLVVQQLAPQFTLRQGQYHVASIFNNAVIKKIRENEDN